MYEIKTEYITGDFYCEKSVRIWSYSGQYFPTFAFSPNAGKYVPE